MEKGVPGGGDPRMTNSTDPDKASKLAKQSTKTKELINS